MQASAFARFEACVLQNSARTVSKPRFLPLVNFYSTSSPAPPPAPRWAKSSLNTAVSNPTNVSQPAYTKSGQLLRVNLSESAARKLAEVREAEKRPELVLRIHVESGGCHGFQYVFQLPNASEITANDSIFERDGSRVVIDHRSLRILRDAEVDYSTELIGSQFRVKSPHTSSACGCGSSFSLDEAD